MIGPEIGKSIPLKRMTRGENDVSQKLERSALKIPNAESPTQIHDSKEWYCVKATSVITWVKEYGNFTERSA